MEEIMEQTTDITELIEVCLEIQTQLAEIVTMQKVYLVIIGIAIAFVGAVIVWRILRNLLGFVSRGFRI